MERVPLKHAPPEQAPEQTRFIGETAAAAPRLLAALLGLALVAVAAFWMIGTDANGTAHASQVEAEAGARAR